MANIRKARKRREYSKWLSYAVIAMWFFILLACLYATFVVITRGD